MAYIGRLFNYSPLGQETPMMTYMNCHAILDNMRSRSSQTKSMGPRVMIVGSAASGKSTLARILLNYAVRMTR